MQATGPLGMRIEPRVCFTPAPRPECRSASQQPGIAPRTPFSKDIVGSPSAAANPASAGYEPCWLSRSWAKTDRAGNCAGRLARKLNHLFHNVWNIHRHQDPRGSAGVQHLAAPRPETRGASLCFRYSRNPPPPLRFTVTVVSWPGNSGNKVGGHALYRRKALEFRCESTLVGNRNPSENIGIALFAPRLLRRKIHWCLQQEGRPYNERTA